MDAGSQRFHWLNTIAGILDSAFHLSDIEQYHTLNILSQLLEYLRIPERGVPAQLPAAVAHEARSGAYALTLAEARSTGIEREVHLATSDITVPLEAWRDALANMVLSAYPDLDQQELELLNSWLGDLLAALGVPRRAATFLPDDVIRAFWRLQPDHV
jgi:hypothetical protein